MQQKKYSEILDSVCNIATEAGNEVMRYYGSSTLKVESKPDSSPLTMADMASHRVIQRGLHAIDSDIPIISEEATLPADKDRLSWKRFWLVDPLDGTKEFIKMNGEFTINIALIENNIPTLGVVYTPTQRRLYYGGVNVPSSVKDDVQKPVKIIANTQKKDAYRVVVSRSHPSPDLDSYLRKLTKFEVITVGSSLKMCYVADGTADIYPRFGPTMEWDVAAGDAVFRYATKSSERRNPSPLTYNKSDLQNSSFVLTAVPQEYLPDSNMGR